MAVAQRANDPAFPTLETSGTKYGISIRDYLAAQALIGLISIQRPPAAGDVFRQAAEAAYKYADAMLQTR